MKKKNNKGFSLIELIIAIAILVILTGLLAPQFMRYMEKSREAKDMQTLDTVYSSVQSALANEKAYSEIKDMAAAADLENIKTIGVSLDTLLGDTGSFGTEVKATLGTDDSAKLWSSKAIADLAGEEDENTVVFVHITDDFRVSAWIGVAGADPTAEKNALSPTGIAGGTDTVKTAGTTFWISK